MKTTTAIEFLRQKSNKRKAQEMEDLKELILQSCEGMMDETNFIIDEGRTVAMFIDIDEVWFDIDNLDFVDWLKKHCLIEGEISSKSATVIGLK